MITVSIIDPANGLKIVAITTKNPAQHSKYGTYAIYLARHLPRHLSVQLESMREGEEPMLWIFEGQDETP